MSPTTKYYISYLKLHEDDILEEEDYAYYDEENYDYYDSGEEAIHNVDT